MLLRHRTFLGGFIAMLVAFTFMGEAAAAAKKKPYGEVQYEACLLSSDAQHSSGSNGDTYCCSKSQGKCVRCPRDGNQSCETFPYSKRPDILQKPKSPENQSGAPKAAPANPAPSKRPTLKTAPNPKISE